MNDIIKGTIICFISGIAAVALSVWGCRNYFHGMQYIENYIQGQNI